MIRIELNNGEGTIELKGEQLLLELELSLIIKYLATGKPDILKRALAHNIELLQKEVESDKNNSDN